MKNKMYKVYARKIGEKFEFIGVVFEGQVRNFIDKIHDKIKYHAYQYEIVK